MAKAQWRMRACVRLWSDVDVSVRMIAIAAQTRNLCDMLGRHLSRTAVSRRLRLLAREENHQ